MLRCDCHTADLRWRVGGDGEPTGSPIFQHGADGFLCVAERFPLRVSLGHDFRQSRNQHGEPAVRLRLQRMTEKLWFMGHLRIERAPASNSTDERFVQGRLPAICRPAERRGLRGFSKPDVHVISGQMDAHSAALSQPFSILVASFSDSAFTSAYASATRLLSLCLIVLIKVLKCFLPTKPDSTMLITPVRQSEARFL